MSPDRRLAHHCCTAEYDPKTLPLSSLIIIAECGGMACTSQGYCALASLANCIDCSYLAINALPCSNVPANTTFIDLSHNGITSLTGASLTGLSTLTYLTLAYNSITVIAADTFSQLTALVYLILSNNKISALPLSVFTTQTAMVYLDLDTNFLTVLPAGLFTAQSALTFLYVHSIITWHIIDHHQGYRHQLDHISRPHGV